MYKFAFYNFHYDYRVVMRYCLPSSKLCSGGIHACPKIRIKHLESRGTWGGGGAVGGGMQYQNTVRKVGRCQKTVSKIDEIWISHL